MSKPRKFAPDVEREIAKSYADGEAAISLMRRFDCSRNVVYKILAREGVPAHSLRPSRVKARGHYRAFNDEQEAEVIRRYTEGQESAEVIGLSLGVAHTTVFDALRRNGVPRRKTGARSGELAPTWKGGRRVISTGYVLAWVSRDEFPSMRRVGGCYLLEHRLVMARHLGRPLERHEQVHHKNGRRDDNRIENLELRVGSHGNGATHPHCRTCTCFAQ